MLSTILVGTITPDCGLTMLSNINNNVSNKALFNIAMLFSSTKNKLPIFGYVYLEKNYSVLFHSECWYYIVAYSPLEDQWTAIKSPGQL